MQIRTLRVRIYTYTVSDFIDPTTGGSAIYSEVRVFKNGSDISKDVFRVWTADGSENLGKYSSDHKAILVNNSEISRIGSIKIDGKVIKITKK